MQSAVVFAFESEEFGNLGQRKYLVTTYYHFSINYLWVYTHLTTPCTSHLTNTEQWNSQDTFMKSSAKVGPPLIKQLHVMPKVWFIAIEAVCRLYFDIEFNVDVNPHTPPIPVLNTFIEV